MDLTHINSNNNPTMVDVSNKNPSFREARAEGSISMSESAFKAMKNNEVKKGPVVHTAIIAAIMGAKKTSELIPMCHPLMLSKVDCNINFVDSEFRVDIEVIVKCEGKTGVEMEALSGVSIGLLTIYDMLKAIDKSMLITNITLLSKSGGRSGDYT